ncbi:Methionyl-tRNA formyltransferase [Ascosphaera acerosa]|nr:Methionyl-tRNA formyltransferase [Ascosphaera acerosa]
MTTARSADPLRILFCGSDEFSINTLHALRDEQLRAPEAIRTIDVVARPPKRVGVKLKRIREVPIRPVAREMSLPLHDVDTFTGWTPPNPFNLIIAVSFGLLIPRRLINAAKYGGLNLHPSLLPDFRGPAPLHHTLLCGETRTGVSLQTLHPDRFDHGVILAQEALEIPDPQDCDVSTLTSLVSIKGADMLRAAIRERLFVPPLTPTAAPARQQHELRHAPKIRKEDSHVDWQGWTAETVLRRNRILGPLWSVAAASAGAGVAATPHADADADAPTRQLRLIIEALRPVRLAQQRPLHEALQAHEQRTGRKLAPGLPFAWHESSSAGDAGTSYGKAGKPAAPDGPLFVRTSDGEILQIDTLKVEGARTAPATRAALKARLFAQAQEDPESRSLLCFQEVLR